MQSFPPTCILRHRRENLKKCSLRGLESHPGFQFFRYPTSIPLPNLSNYILLAMDGPPLQQTDSSKGLFILDATWRHAESMRKFIDGHTEMEKRSIPSGFRTAYPRRQEDCPCPEAGLASIEAIYIAYKLLGRSTEGLLDAYYWKEVFLSQNFQEK